MNVFISYSQKDTKFKDRLMTHLGAFRKENRIYLWHDKMIGVGEDWRITIDNALKRADAAILLVSADFLASEFICDTEVPLFLERRAKEGLRMIPVIIKPCAWEKVSWLSEIQAIHVSERNIGFFRCFFNLFGKMERDCAFVAKKVHEALKLEKSAISTPKPQKPNRLKAGGLNLKAPVFIEIKADGGHYIGRIHQGAQSGKITVQGEAQSGKNAVQGFPLDELKLDRKVKPLDDQSITLGHILDSIIKFAPKKLKNFIERIQLDLGQYLYDQTLGNLPEKEQEHLRDAKDLDLRILTEGSPCKTVQVG